MLLSFTVHAAAPEFNASRLTADSFPNPNDFVVYSGVNLTNYLVNSSVDNVTFSIVRTQGSVINCFLNNELIYCNSSKNSISSNSRFNVTATNEYGDSNATLIIIATTNSYVISNPQVDLLEGESNDALLNLSDFFKPSGANLNIISVSNESILNCGLNSIFLNCTAGTLFDAQDVVVSINVSPSDFPQNYKVMNVTVQMIPQVLFTNYSGNYTILENQRIEGLVNLSNYVIRDDVQFEMLSNSAIVSCDVNGVFLDCLGGSRFNDATIIVRVNVSLSDNSHSDVLEIPVFYEATFGVTPTTGTGGSTTNLQSQNTQTQTGQAETGEVTTDTPTPEPTPAPQTQAEEITPEPVAPQPTQTTPAETTDAEGNLLAGQVTGPVGESGGQGGRTILLILAGIVAALGISYVVYSKK